MVANLTPLITLDAIVIDTETTGLDPAKARIVEIAGLRLAVGEIDNVASFRSLVRPDQPIPATATQVHGIDNVAVADAPSFAAVWPQFKSYSDGSVLIGHSIGFDIAVLKRECGRIGAGWQPGVTLDTQLLAQVVNPSLATPSLEHLAVWLNVEIIGRHSALGDAAAAARIFLALIPRLRARGIRTLAEALRASSQLTGALDSQRAAGWSLPETAVSAMAPAPVRIDSYPYRHRAGAIMSAPPKFVGRDAPLAAALDVMARERISSVLVVDGAPIPDRTGIITERDLLSALSAHGASALTLPVARVMSTPLVTVPADAFAYLAIGRMNWKKIRHLGVTDMSGRVVGVLSARGLLQLRGESGIELGDEIEQAADARGLARAWARLPLVARDLYGDAVTAREVAAVISHQLCETTHRAVALAEASMKSEGRGDPPCRYAFVVLGSAGRGESLLAMDQDNALIFEDGAPAGVDCWFEELGVRTADILHEAGVPYCPGGVMAKNPQWRGSLRTWRARVADWIARSSPQDLLAVDIFFDLDGVHGDTALAETLWRDALDAAEGQAGFAKMLIEARGFVPSGLNWFGGLRAEQGRIDLKKTGLFGIVTSARALAICHHVTERSTPARLAGIKALGLGMESDLDALDEAQAVFLDFILAQQLLDIEQGRPPSNAVEVRRLTRRQRERLRTALRAVEPLEAVTRDLLFRS